MTECSYSIKKKKKIVTCNTITTNKLLMHAILNDTGCLVMKFNPIGEGFRSFSGVYVFGTIPVYTKRSLEKTMNY